MADDVIDILAKCKPAPVNRDAMLFAAGQAAARRKPIWKWLCFLLIGSQLATLGMWLFPNQSSMQEHQPIVSPAIEVPAAILPSVEPWSVPWIRSGSLQNLERTSSEPVPSSSVIPEEHWSVRTAMADLDLD